MQQISNTQELLESFKNRNVLIVGDVMVDEYVWGKVSRISPEAPVPVVSCDKREHRMGGAANVAINIKSLGATPIMCSVIGKDETGRTYRSLLKKRQMTDEGIIESPDRITTVKTRVIGNHQHLLRFDQEITAFIDEHLELQLLSKIEQILDSRKIDAVIFQDYDKGVLTPNIIRRISSMVAERKISSLVDPKKRSFSAYSNVQMFKPNFKELVEGLNIDIKKSDTSALFEACKQIHRENNIKYVMVTLSELGVFISDGEQYNIIPAEIRDITDVSGAGDTVVSTAALCLAVGLSAFQTAKISNIAGGLVCEKVGVVPINPELLLNEGIEF